LLCVLTATGGFTLEWMPISSETCSLAKLSV
jgi:hypothetical protein